MTKTNLNLILFLLCGPLTNTSHLSSHPFLNALSLNTYISGKVLDATTEQPLEYATISVFNSIDGSLVNGNITDAKGFFKINLPPNQYYLTIEFLAYQQQKIENIIVTTNSKDIDVGTIVLRPLTAALEEVTVRAEQSELVMTLDKKVFHVGKDLASVGGSATDLLDNIPSVQIDEEGRVSLRGKEGVKVLVDGKPSILVSSAGGLRTLQANMIDRVEIITNPSARYEGQGTAGILNIILKKNQKKGINGSFDVKVGYPGNHGLAFNLNHRRKKLNFFTNYGINFRKNPSEGSKYQEIYQNDTTFIIDQYADEEQNSLSNNFRLGADYFFNQKNTLTTAFAYGIYNNRNFNTITYQDYFFNLDNLTDITERMEEENEKELKLEYALTYKKTFDKKDHKLTIDLRYQDENIRETSEFNNRFYNPNFSPNGMPDLLQQAHNDKTTAQFIVQADYVHPFSKHHKFEAGLRSSTRTIDNDYLVEEWKDDLWLPLDRFNDYFKFRENVNAVYAQYGNKIKQFSYLLGFRMEYNIIETELIRANETSKRAFFTPIPTLHLSYDLEKNNAIQFSYSRRLRRPLFWDVNPFFTFTDARNFFEGNTDLNPEFSHSLELGHIKRWDKGSINTAVYYRHTTEKIERVREVYEDGTFVTSPQNLDTQNTYGLELTTAYTPFKWWRLNGNLNFFRAITDGTNINERLKSDTYTWFFKGTSKFTLPKKTQIQINFNYRAPKLRPQGKDFSIASLHLSASRTVLKEKGKLTLSVRDVFNSYRYRYTAEGFDFFTQSSQQWQSRNITLSLNYRLSQQ